MRLSWVSADARPRGTTLRGAAWAATMRVVSDARQSPVMREGECAVCDEGHGSLCAPAATVAARSSAAAHMECFFCAIKEFLFCYVFVFRCILYVSRWFAPAIRGNLFGLLVMKLFVK
jgi:hypothetical protein